MRCILTIVLSFASIYGFSQSEVESDSLHQEASPIITFDTTVLDLGSIPEDTVVHRTFHFQNTGNDTLEILSTKSDCSCTVPKIIKKKYAPNESGSIEVSFNSEQNLGRVLQYVTIFHNGPKGYTFLKLQGFVFQQL